MLNGDRMRIDDILHEEKVNKEEIKRTLDKYFNIGSTPTITNDGVISIGSYCMLKEKTLIEYFPVSFKKIGGFFKCVNNQLISLNGAPSYVGKQFDCSNNKLTSLIGCPTDIGGYLNCCDNPLTSLVGFPKNLTGTFNCSWSPIIPLLRLLNVNSDIIIREKLGKTHPITDLILQYKFKQYDNPRIRILDCKRALTDAGYGGNAKW
jgi:hypothetical protein